MGALLYRWAPLFARLLTVPIFFYSGWSKLSAPASTAVYFASTFIQNLGVSAQWAELAMWRFLAVAAGSVEILGGLLLLAGWRTRLGALALFFYLVPVTLVAHVLGWYHAADVQAVHQQALAMFKNMAIGAALLQLGTYGPGRPSVDVRD